MNPQSRIPLGNNTPSFPNTTQNMIDTLIWMNPAQWGLLCLTYKLICKFSDAHMVEYLRNPQGLNLSQPVAYTMLNSIKWAYQNNYGWNGTGEQKPDEPDHNIEQVNK